jgi:hypothetical protein
VADVVAVLDALDIAKAFARQRVRPAHRDTLLTEPRTEEWLLIEWPQGEAEPTKYWFATLSGEIAFEHLVDFAKLRWRIERDYQELKQELGLGDYEGLPQEHARSADRSWSARWPGTALFAEGGQDQLAAGRSGASPQACVTIHPCSCHHRRNQVDLFFKVTGSASSPKAVGEPGNIRMTAAECQPVYRGPEVVLNEVGPRPTLCCNVRIGGLDWNYILSLRVNWARDE